MAGRRSPDLCLLYDPKPKLLKRLSGSSQLRLTLEELPEVEVIPSPEPVLNGTIAAAQSFVNATDLSTGQKI